MSVFFEPYKAFSVQELFIYVESAVQMLIVHNFVNSIKKNLYFLRYFLIVLLIVSCSSNEELPDERLVEKELYDQAQSRLKSASYSTAIISLESLESRFPFGRYAEQAQAELIYAYYMNSQFEASESAAQRFINLHPRHSHTGYAYYMKGLAAFTDDAGLFVKMQRPKRLKADDNEQLFEEGEMKIDDKNLGEGSLTTYKELCTVATELGQPELIYRFLNLAGHQKVWNSRRGAAFGFSLIANKAAAGQGGAVQYERCEGVVLISESHFDSNLAENGGGAVYLDNCSPSI